MGNCSSGLRRNSPQDKAEMSRSRNIDKQIKADEKRMKNQVKLLLLGAGESGKSTVLRQMRLIHAAGFTAAEREAFRVIVYTNVISVMQIILEAMQKLNIAFEDPSLAEYSKVVEAVVPEQHSQEQLYLSKLLEPLKRMWADSGAQEARRHGNAFALHDNAAYFYDQLDRLWEPDYMPTDQDIICCRAKTTGIIETVFHLGPLTYRMFDVGGQRSERKKWIHCFENVTAVLFVVAISGYDQCLIEDRDSNQMHESLMLFNNICNSPWFVKTSMILFLNKMDIFKDKIKTSSVSHYFPDFTGDDKSLEQTRSYFKRRFQRLNQNSEKAVYVHYTNATDTQLLEHVMTAVADIILNDNINTLM